jgi:hypothetical protein
MVRELDLGNLTNLFQLLASHFGRIFSENSRTLKVSHWCHFPGFGGTGMPRSHTKNVRTVIYMGIVQNIPEIQN